MITPGLTAHAGARRPTRVRQRLPEPGSRAERELQRQTTLVRKRDATEAVRNPSVTTNPLIQEIRAVYEEGGLSAMQAFGVRRSSSNCGGPGHTRTGLSP